MSDPTQPGGQEVRPTQNARNAVMAQIAEQTQAAQAEDLSSFNEDTGEIEGAQTKPEAQQDTPEPEQKPAEQKRIERIVVDGQEVEVDFDKVLEAGRRALQKDTAADRRLQEASLLRKKAEELLNQARGGQQNQTPSQDASSPAQATEGVTPETLTTLVQGLEAQLTQRVMSTLTATQAVQKFREEFSDIAGDPDLWQIAVTRNQSRLDHAAAVGAPPGDDLEAYRKIGQEIRQKFAPKAAVAEDKVDRKRTITAIPAINAKAPAPQEQKPKSTAETIEEMRRLRTQGFRTQGFQRLRT